ncbi:FAD binding domain-containing protein [Blastomyces dermatitidis ATCC 18188]|uniref:Delta(24)-sterol reductase n=1 Tax=Ajellomyces dermatitidis (strain ATCC 18188 / CBS 674.68) TaxID=653446 RepID=F2TDR0_AJEDA|nr:FAD binding domain-containing protein [Blastomyces dermatitidis ATCC 18188]
MDEHNAAVAAISAQVRRFHSTRTPFRIYHGSTNTTRPTSFQRDRLVDTSSLNRVLRIDRLARTALVEPNVPMDALVAATLEAGLVPPVVMEFPGITVGGGFAGMGGESSSFRYGMFHETVRWVEVVKGDGAVVVASSSSSSSSSAAAAAAAAGVGSGSGKQHAEDADAEDLFHGAAGTMGTLGITTLLELQLIDARAFVEVSYWPVSSVHDAVETVRAQAARPPGEVDYVDAILFSADRGVVVAGRLTDAITAPDGRIQRFTRAHDPWFYLHAEEVVAKSPPPQPQPPSTTTTTAAGPIIIETVPLTDYLFRYDRGAFWTGFYAFKYFRVPFTASMRWLLDGFMHTRVMYHALHRSGFAQRYIIQDLALPHGAAAEEFVEFVRREEGVGDRWVLHSASESSSSSAAAAPQSDEMQINVGLWCPGPSTTAAFVKVNRAIEQKVRALRGTKWLYAHTYYTEEEFWDIYDRQWYEGLREKYGATYLPDVYEKVRVKKQGQAAGQGEGGLLGRLTGWVWTIWPLAGVYGVMSTMVGGRGYLVEGERRGGKIAVGIVVLGLLWVLASYWK